MFRFHAFVTALVTLCLLSAASTAATAQDPTAAARAHFQRGLEFFDEARFDAALAEFQRAYDISPAAEALYNLGRVHAELGHAVEATDVFERYLREPGDAVTAERREEVTRRLSRQRQRIGYLSVRTLVEGAVISIDDVDVASTPLREPIRLSAGSHSLAVRAPGYDAVHLGVQIAGGERLERDVTLRREIDPTGVLRISASIAQIEIRVDDEVVGLTPLARTVPVPSGNHVVSASRAGYVSEERRIHVADGAELDVAFDLELDEDPAAEDVGHLALRLPNAPALVRVDGENQDADIELRLPAGVHVLRVEVADRQPHMQEIVVPAGQTLDITVRLSWTPDEQERRRDAAARRRRVGLAFTVVGGALLVSSLPVLAWNAGEISDTDAEVRDILRMDPTGMGVCTSSRCSELRDDQQRQNIIRGTMLAATGVGLAFATAGLVLWLGAPSEADIDESASAVSWGLDLGPGHLGLRGRF